MFIRKKGSKNKNSTRVQIVETYKVGKKTVQKILTNVGIAHDEKVVIDEPELDRLKKVWTCYNF